MNSKEEIKEKVIYYEAKPDEIVMLNNAKFTTCYKCDERLEEGFVRLTRKQYKNYRVSKLYCKKCIYNI